MMYHGILTMKEVVKVLRMGLYHVDFSDGTVYGQRGQAIKPFSTARGGNNPARRFVRLYWAGKRKAIAVARLVWVAKTLKPIPPGFEIHHWDEDAGNDAWENLFCWHELDHKKFHAKNNGNGKHEEIPF